MRSISIVLTAVVLQLALAQPAPAAASGGFVYALNQGDSAPNQLFGFRLDEATGALTALSGFPINTGGTGILTFASEHVRYDPATHRLYVINDGSDTLSVFAVNSGTGALTAAPFSPIPLGVGSWGCVTVHPSGSPVVVGDGNGTLASFVVTPTTATAAAGSPFATRGVLPFSCTFSKDGNDVYTGGILNSVNNLSGFSVAPSTGVLTQLPGSPFSSGARPVGHATDNTGRLFIVNAASNQVRVFTTSSGIPTGVAGNPFSAGGLSLSGAGVLHPAGFYVVMDSSGQVGVYQISGSGSGTTLAGVAGSPFQSGGSNATSLAVTTSGSVLLAANGGSRNLNVFRVNQGTGGLTSLLLQPQNTLGASGFVTGVEFVPQVAALRDFDGDGKGDLMLRNKVTGQNVGWLMFGITVSNAALFPTIADTTWEVKGIGDFDGDGRADVIWRRNNPTGENIGWLMNGLTVANAAFLPTIGDGNWEIKGVGDFNGDGKADVMWRNKVTGQNIGWLMNGLAVATAAFLPTIADTNWEIKGIGDVDGDGKADVILRNKVSGQNICWLMNGLTVANAAFLATIADTNWDIKGVGDFDGDGKADVIWRNGATGQNIGWLMNGLIVSNAAFLSTIGDLNWEIKGVADVSGDRKADVVWRNKVTGQNIVWLMNGLTVAIAALMPTIADVNWDFVGQGQ